MINLDFSLAIALYLGLVISMLIFWWFFSREKQTKEFTLEEKFIWFCSVCTYTYVNTKEETITVCPRCGSYNKK